MLLFRFLPDRTDLFIAGLSVLTFLGNPQLEAAGISGTFASIPKGSNVNLSAIGTLDWVHWGLYTESSVNRKAGVDPQISSYSVIGDVSNFVAAYQYTDNFNGYSWLDGMPVASVTNTTTGVWAYGWPISKGTGFQLSVPADTNPRVLKVFVGAYAAKGQFTASLSDGSGSFISGNVPDSTVDNPTNGDSGVFAISYSAGSAGQTLTVTWIVALMHRVDANVTLQAATLSAPGQNIPPFVTLTSPVQDAAFATSSDMTLSARASDADGMVTNVEFYAGTNLLGATAMAPYDLTWANPPPGRYSLTVVAADDAGAKMSSQPVEIFVCSGSGSLSGTADLPPIAVNLTTEGSADWTHWGALTPDSFDYKNIGTRKISNFTKLGAQAVECYANNRTAFSWNDGTPTPSTNGTSTGVFITGYKGGFQITAPADGIQRTLRVYAGGYGVQGHFQAWLSDFSAPPYTDTSVSNVYGDSYVVYALTYMAASPGQSLMVVYRSDNLFDLKYGNITLQAATLQGGPVYPVPPYLSYPQVNGNDFLFSCLTQTGQNYWVEYSPSLSPTNWQILTNFAGDGTTWWMTNGNASSSSGFYRVRTE